MKNKGFTLVELLAVIVILAIIMIISIPAVLNTMTSARKKTFGEYVTKVYDAAQKKYMSDEMLGNSITYVQYDITKDLGLDNTGDFRGYVVFYKNGVDTDVYIGLSDNEYHTVTQLTDDISSRVNYINYTLGGEPEFDNNPTKFIGKNTFTNGSINTFDLPENNDTGDLTPITKNISKEEQFETELKKFKNDAFQRFLSDEAKKRAGQDVPEITISPLKASGSDKEIGSAVVGFYPIETIYNETSNNGWFIACILFSDDEDSMPYFGEALVAYKNSDFRTTSRTYQMNQSRTEKIVETVPYISLVTTSTEKPNTIPFVISKTTNLTPYDTVEAQLELQTNIDPNKTYTRNEMVPIFNDLYSKMMAGMNKYVDINYNDGLDKVNDYIFSQYMLKGKINLSL